MIVAILVFVSSAIAQFTPASPPVTTTTTATVSTSTIAPPATTTTSRVPSFTPTGATQTAPYTTTVSPTPFPPQGPVPVGPTREATPSPYSYSDYFTTTAYSCPELTVCGTALSDCANASGGGSLVCGCYGNFLQCMNRVANSCPTQDFSMAISAVSMACTTLGCDKDCSGPGNVPGTPFTPLPTTTCSAESLTKLTSCGTQVSSCIAAAGTATALVCSCYSSYIGCVDSTDSCSTTQMVIDGFQSACATLKCTTCGTAETCTTVLAGCANSLSSCLADGETKQCPCYEAYNKCLDRKHSVAAKCTGYTELRDSIDSTCKKLSCTCSSSIETSGGSDGTTGSASGSASGGSVGQTTPALFESTSDAAALVGNGIAPILAAMVVAISLSH